MTRHRERVATAAVAAAAAAAAAGSYRGPARRGIAGGGGPSRIYAYLKGIYIWLHARSTEANGVRHFGAIPEQSRKQSLAALRGGRPAACPCEKESKQANDESDQKPHARAMERLGGARKGPGSCHKCSAAFRGDPALHINCGCRRDGWNLRRQRRRRRRRRRCRYRREGSRRRGLRQGAPPRGACCQQAAVSRGPARCELASDVVDATRGEQVPWRNNCVRDENVCIF